MEFRYNAATEECPNALLRYAFDAQALDGDDLRKLPFSMRAVRSATLRPLRFDGDAPSPDVAVRHIDCWRIYYDHVLHVARLSRSRPPSLPGRLHRLQPKPHGVQNIKNHSKIWAALFVSESAIET